MKDWRYLVAAVEDDAKGKRKTERGTRGNEEGVVQENESRTTGP